VQTGRGEEDQGGRQEISLSLSLSLSAENTNNFQYMENISRKLKKK
jgi:hypothetical protein